MQTGHSAVVHSRTKLPIPPAYTSNASLFTPFPLKSAKHQAGKDFNDYTVKVKWFILGPTCILRRIYGYKRAITLSLLYRGGNSIHKRCVFIMQSYVWLYLIFHSLSLFKGCQIFVKRFPRENPVISQGPDHVWSVSPLIMALRCHCVFRVSAFRQYKSWSSMTSFDCYDMFNV